MVFNPTNCQHIWSLSHQRIFGSGILAQSPLPKISSVVRDLNFVTGPTNYCHLHYLVTIAHPQNMSPINWTQNSLKGKSVVDQ